MTNMNKWNFSSHLESSHVSTSNSRPVASHIVSYEPFISILISTLKIYTHTNPKYEYYFSYEPLKTNAHFHI